MRGFSNPGESNQATSILTTIEAANECNRAGAEGFDPAVRWRYEDGKDAGVHGRTLDNAIG
jgi:hypothetical protein